VVQKKKREKQTCMLLQKKGDKPEHIPASCLESQVDMPPQESPKALGNAR
jgi:hypothetical protein